MPRIYLYLNILLRMAALTAFVIYFWSSILAISSNDNEHENLITDDAFGNKPEPQQTSGMTQFFLYNAIGQAKTGIIAWIIYFLGISLDLVGLLFILLVFVDPAIRTEIREAIFPSRGTSLTQSSCLILFYCNMPFIPVFLLLVAMFRLLYAQMLPLLVAAIVLWINCWIGSVTLCQVSWPLIHANLKAMLVFELAIQLILTLAASRLVKRMLKGKGNEDEGEDYQSEQQEQTQVLVNSSSGGNVFRNSVTFAHPKKMTQGNGLLPQ